MGRYDDGMTVIPIAAALIEDGAGHVLLVRKADTRFFMQAGGKIEPGEEPAAALVRELHEEIGLIVAEADLVDPAQAHALPLAPLTRDYILPLWLDGMGERA